MDRRQFVHHNGMLRTADARHATRLAEGELHREARLSATLLQLKVDLSAQLSWVLA